MTDPTPTPDAVDFEQASRVAHTLALGADGLPPRDLLTLARAYLALRSPVPAEATNGAEPSETDINAVLRSIGSQSEFFGRLGDGIVKVDITVGTSLIHHRKFTLAALRTPPAPLPTQGREAEKPEPFKAEVKGWTTHDSPLSLSYHGASLDLLTLFIPESPLPRNGGPARHTTVRRRDLLAALSASTGGDTTKEK